MVENEKKKGKAKILLSFNISALVDLFKGGEPIFFRKILAIAKRLVPAASMTRGRVSVPIKSAIATELTKAMIVKIKRKTSDAAVCFKIFAPDSYVDTIFQQPGFANRRLM